MRLLPKPLAHGVTVVALWVLLTSLGGGILPYLLLRGLDVADMRGTLTVGVVFAFCSAAVVLFGIGTGPTGGARHRLVEGARTLLRVLGLRRSGIVGLVLIGAGTAAVLLLIGAKLGDMDWQSLAGDQPPTQDIRRDWTEPLSIPGLIALGALATPPGEELLFRGGLLLSAAGLTRARVLPPWLRSTLIIVALLATSGMFGLIHGGYSIQNVTSAGINGLVWGTVALKTRSIIPAVAGHAIFNTAVFLGWSI